MSYADSSSSSESEDDGGNLCDGVLTQDVRNALINILSSWYFSQIDVIKNNETIGEFNPIIDRVFDCSSSTTLDICIGTQINCVIGEWSNCDGLRNEQTGYYQNFNDILVGIGFGQIFLECFDKNTIQARLTKDFFTSQGDRFNDDNWIFKKIDNTNNERNNWRAMSWRIFTQSQ